MLRDDLISIIKRYHLNGAVDNVLWKIENNKFICNFISENKDLVGKINTSNIGFPDSEIGIYNTKNLLKLIKILDDEINISKTKTKLILEDQKYKIRFPLTDFTPAVPNINLPDFDLSFNITDEFSNDFKKAKKAIGNEYEFFSITNDKFVLEDDSEYSTKIEINFEPKSINNKKFKLYFPSDYLLNILDSNDDEGEIRISEKGLMYIKYPEFEYYIVASKKKQ